MDQYIKLSLDAFNVSKNCDRTNDKTFYDSYLKRKGFVIEQKLNAAEKGNPINQRKLQWELKCFKEVKDNEIETRSYLKKLLKKTTITDNNLIKSARELIGALG